MRQKILVMCGLLMAASVLQGQSRVVLDPLTGQVMLLPASTAVGYPAVFTGVTGLTVTAATHKQGTKPVGFCYDDSVPAVPITQTAGFPTVSATGQIVFAWTGSKNGYCLISALGSAVGATGPQGPIGPQGPSGSGASTGSNAQQGDGAGGLANTSIHDNGTFIDTPEYYTAGPALSAFNAFDQSTVASANVANLFKMRNHPTRWAPLATLNECNTTPQIWCVGAYFQSTATPGTGQTVINHFGVTPEADVFATDTGRVTNSGTVNGVVEIHTGHVVNLYGLTHSIVLDAGVVVDNLFDFAPQPHNIDVTATVGKRGGLRMPAYRTGDFAYQSLGAGRTQSFDALTTGSGFDSLTPGNQFGVKGGGDGTVSAGWITDADSYGCIVFNNNPCAISNYHIAGNGTDVRINAGASGKAIFANNNLDTLTIDINGVVVNRKSFSAAAADHTLPIKTGALANLPVACTQGEVYFVSNATAGQNLYYCTVAGNPGTWVQQLNSGSGAGTAPITATFNTATSTCSTSGGGSCTASPACTIAGVSGTPPCIVVTHNFGTGTAVPPWPICGNGPMLGGTSATTSVGDTYATSTNVASVAFSAATAGSCVFSTGSMGPAGTNGTNGSTGATGPGYTATSTTSLVTAGSGSKAFTTQAALAYTSGARIRATSAGTAEYMEGVVSAYSGTTLTVTMDRNSGTGTHADWNINLAGDVGANGSGTGDMLKATYDAANKNAQILATTDLDTDSTMAANSDAKVATQKAVKTALATKGDASGPGSSTLNHVPQFADTTGKLLKDGLGLSTTVATPGVDTNVPTEKAVRDAITAAAGGAVAPASLEWLPYGYAAYVAGGQLVASAANRGHSQDISPLGPIAFDRVVFNIDTAATGTHGLVFSVYSITGSTLYCVSTVGVGGSGTADFNINTTGMHALTFASGANVSGGVCSLSAGSYLAVWATDDTTLKISTYGDNITSRLLSRKANIRWGDFTAAISTGSGSSIVPTADISAVTVGSSTSAFVLAMEK